MAIKKLVEVWDGKDLIVKVPPGTEIYNEDKNVLLADLTAKEQKTILAYGRKGGLGNSHFKTSTVSYLYIA